MAKIGIIFPGQGAQYPGMGEKLYEAYPEIRELYENAEKIFPGITEISFHGTADDLKKTENTQPALYLAELSAALILKKNGIEASALAGFSLGEIPALSFGGAFDYIEGFRIVCKRGEFMSADPGVETAMAAVLKLDGETVEKICASHSGLYPVNYNCPGQITVSGTKEALNDAKAEFTEAGGRVIPLAVSGAFHSPFMDKASEEFGAFLSTCDIKSPVTTVYANRNAAPYENVVETMQAQINHPVLWEKTVRAMAESGVDTFIEVGPGQTLSKFVQKTVPGAKTYHAETPEEIEKIVSEVL
ncbi:MAG: ACP S-malonyltransferase [Eubacteriales bacterium]|nr:ACP S-malonyltransferase [Clostridia bacterium]MDY2845749.1 ACP S-malonyltransferase [Eubacteriales bacterium]